VAVAAEKNPTLVLPCPVELLRFLEKAQQQGVAAPPPVAQPVQEQLPAPQPRLDPDLEGSNSRQD
jgi:hypothetical protein